MDTNSAATSADTCTIATPADANSAPAKPRILRSKFYLYLTEFFSGISVMAAELGASRLLAPYFSSSQIVWTIIIGTIMIAMALGNVFGGRWADKDPNPDKLYRRILIAAVWLSAIPSVGKLVILLVSGLLVVTISTNFLIWAGFLSCMVIFVFPLFLLGTVTPSLVKYTTQSLEDNGRVVGMLGASNTIGSIIGTFAPTFLTIPAIGTAGTFAVFSGVLLCIGFVYFISEKKRIVGLVISGTLFVGFTIAGLSFGFAFWETNLSYEGESIYNYLQVRETDQDVRLSTNVLFGVQSIYEKDGSLSGMYYDYAMAAPLMNERQGETSILILGMGTGTYATQCKNYLDDVAVEGVEIDQKITDLAHTYFALPESVPVTTYDGRAFLNVSEKKYDVIMVDAYQDITIPFQMSSQEFFSLVSEHLNENGVVVVNMNMRSDRPDGINAWLSDTISSVFGNVYTVNVEDGTNRELFASHNGAVLELLRENVQSLEDGALKSMMELVERQLVRYEPGERILTDDRAPVELLGMQVIDDMISTELDYYRQLLREEGLRGLLG